MNLAAEPSPRALLNESQQRRLVATCRYIDRLLGEVEVILTAASSRSPFGRYVDDIVPVQKRVITDSVARVRTQMVRALAAADTLPPRPDVGALWAVRVALNAVDTAVEELRPHHMTGYGALAPEAGEVLSGLVEELQASVRQIGDALAAGTDIDLAARVERLALAGHERDALALLQRVIERHGMIEFRRPLTIILDRLEDQRFEVAVFGRVSTGKSSLLNHLLGSEVLPVGVTPITAVPTRIVHGEVPRVHVRFADAAAQTLPLERLADFAAERNNPGNARHVTRLVCELPAAILESGLVFVDTPGLGSLATSGAEETLAYLPRCDLAIVLIDGTSALSGEDVETVALLLHAGIPPLVAISKGDLLREPEREQIVSYVRSQLAAQLAADLPVGVVSTVAAHRTLVQDWLALEVQPRIADHHEAVKASIRRKIAGLFRAVEDALEARLRRPGGGLSRERLESLEAALRSASAGFSPARTECRAIVDRLSASGPSVIRQAALQVAGEPHAAEAGAALRERLAAAATAAGLELRQVLVSLSERLGQVLREVAAGLHVQPPAEVSEALDVIPALPRPDVAVPSALRVPSHWRLLGRGAAARLIGGRLSKAAGRAVAANLDGQARLLDHWTQQAVAGLHARFEADADPLRTYLARGLDGASATASESVAQDLEAIRALTASSPGASASRARNADLSL